MRRLRCPLCSTSVAVPEGQAPVCPSCGFGRDARPHEGGQAPSGPPPPAARDPRDEAAPEPRGGAREAASQGQVAYGGPHQPAYGDQREPAYGHPYEPADPYGPPSGRGMPEPAAATAAQARRHPTLTVLLAIVTFGIHPLVWAPKARRGDAQGPFRAVMVLHLLGLTLLVVAAALYVVVWSLGAVTPFSSQTDFSTGEAWLFLASFAAVVAAVLVYIPAWITCAVAAKRVGAPSAPPAPPA